MIYELIAVNTESNTATPSGNYTTSKRKADLFEKLPKIQFTDSGHGIVFMANKLVGKKEKRIHILRDYVNHRMPTLARELKSGE